MKTNRTTRHRASPMRRGSFLVLVVGMLALLAVIAIIYVSIGNQDLRTRSALARQDRLEEVPRGAAQYIANIIGEDALATRYDFSGAEGRVSVNGPIIQTRENTDYPSILLNARSDISTANATQIPFDPVGRYDAIGAGGTPPDVWPASDPFLAACEPSFIYDGTAGAYAGVPPSEHYRLRKDWASITNVAPDGRFVNLFNLRNNFDAEPGVGTDTNGRRRLSEYLTLLNDDGSPASSTDWGAALDPNIPAHFTMRQRHAFRPMGSWPTGFGVGDAAYPPYQWADTDGDGMFDGRWFQGTDSRDGTLRRLFGEGDGRYRYFFAVRVVDLSARVNLNTATDQRVAPNEAGVAGLSPADVDLRRLLTGYDTYELYQGSPVALGFAGIPQPLVATRVDYYGDITAPIQFNAGAWGYESLRMTHAAGVVPPATLAPGAQLPAAFQGFLAPLALNAADWNFKSGEPRNRAAFYERRAKVSQSASPAAGGRMDSRAGYDVDSLVELLTRNSVNDPSMTSAFEQTVGGRADQGMDPARRYSPVRDNRALDVETARPVVNGMARPDVMHMLATDPRQRLTTLSGAAPRRAARGVQGEVLSSADVKVDVKTLLNRISSTPQPGQEPLRDLYRAYADALLPFSDVQDSWRGLPATNTLCYGHRGPMLAAMTAAHMSVNLADSYDVGTGAKIATLLFNNERVNDLNNDISQPPATQLYPGWGLGNGMYLTDSRAATNASGLAFDAINIYGVEAQPFITQVATYTAYADEPGASDFEGSGQEVEINGTLDLGGNKEFLYRAVVFQLTNPFGTDVVLSRDTWASVSGNAWQNADMYDQGDANIPEADRESDYFYVRWAGRNYKLAALREQTYVDSATGGASRAGGFPAVDDDARIGQYISPPAGGGLDITSSGITIPAGGSIVCYALTESPQKILARFRDVDPTLVVGGIGSLRSSVVRVIQNDIQVNQANGIDGIFWIGAIDDATGRYDFTSTPAALAGTGSPSQTVEVWRTVRVGTELAPQALAPPALFWDGVTPSPAGAIEFFPRNVRENDQLMDRFRMPVGVDLNRKLPDGVNKIQGTDADNDNDGYALTMWAAARRPSDPALAGQLPRGAFPGYCIEPKYNASWNVPEPGNDFGSDLDDNEFVGNPATGRTVEDWRRNMMGQPLVQEMARHPSRTTSPRMTSPPRANPGDLDTLNYQDLYPEFVIDNARFERTPAGSPSGTLPSSILRPMDLLLPMGIGPTSNFLFDHTARPNARWTTLGEALAAAMGYEGTTASPADTADISLLLRPDPATPQRKLYDRGGNLRVDDYVLFLDRNANGVFDQAVGQPDIRMGDGIPAALSIPDIFYVSPVNQRAPSLTRIEPGLININTAPVEVARMIPMLSPPPAGDPLGGAWWWWTGAAHDTRSDIAATVVAYRDKNDTVLRVPAANATGYGVVSFYDAEQFLNPLATKSRQTSARTDALRESLGFSGTGELLACRNIPDSSAAGDYELPWSIDYLGYDGRATGSPTNSSRAGVDSVLYKNGQTDEIRNEYKEKLSLANAALPSITTRSDVFAVWFVVHGYQKSDVEVGVNGPTGQRPMVPSIARRFVMVVDRSNVVQKGQHPNILLLREVPY